MNWDGSVIEAKGGWRLNDSGHINNDNTTDNISCLYYTYFVLNLAVSILLILANIVFFFELGTVTILFYDEDIVFLCFMLILVNGRARILTGAFCFVMVFLIPTVSET